MPKPTGIQYRLLAHEQVKAFTNDAGERVIRQVLVSTSGIDRYGDVIDQNGWELTNYEQNPMVLWGHDHDRPVARATRTWVDPSLGLMQEHTFPKEGENADSDLVYSWIMNDLVRATSVGFMGKSYEFVENEDGSIGIHFLRSELLEVSWVTVPANAEALIQMKKLGKTDPEIRKLLKALDEFKTKEQEAEAARNLIVKALEGTDDEDGGDDAEGDEEGSGDESDGTETDSEIEPETPESGATEGEEPTDGSNDEAAEVENETETETPGDSQDQPDPVKSALDNLGDNIKALSDQIAPLLPLLKEAAVRSNSTEGDDTSKDVLRVRQAMKQVYTRLSVGLYLSKQVKKAE